MDWNDETGLGSILIAICVIAMLVLAAILIITLPYAGIGWILHTAVGAFVTLRPAGYLTYTVIGAAFVLVVLWWLQ